MEFAHPKIVTLTSNPAIDIATSVPMVTPLQKLRCTAARRDPGGGGINVARVVQRLGGNAVAIYPVGGSTGELLRRLVDRTANHTTAPGISSGRDRSFDPYAGGTPYIVRSL